MSDVHIPDFDDIREGSWNGPNFEDFVEARDLSEDTYDKLPEEEKQDVSSAFVWSTSQFPPDNYTDLKGPVVDPEGNLVLSGLRNAKSRAGQIKGIRPDDREEGVEIINDLANENFEDADFEENAEDTEEVEVRTAAERMIEDQKGPKGYEERMLDYVEYRQEGDDTIEGYPAVFDQPHELLDMKEVFRKGAFKKTIKEAGIVALFNHDANLILGRDTAGTLNVEERDRGLYTEIDVPSSPLGQNVRTAVERGDVKGGSIGMKVHKEDIVQADDGTPLREIKEAELRDVGPVTFPASSFTEMEARDMTGIISRADMKHDIDLFQLYGTLYRAQDGRVQSEEDQKVIERGIKYLKELATSDSLNDVDREELDRRISVVENL